MSGLEAPSVAGSGSQAIVESAAIYVPCSMIMLDSVSEDVSWQPGGTLPES